MSSLKTHTCDDISRGRRWIESSNVIKCKRTPPSHLPDRPRSISSELPAGCVFQRSNAIGGLLPVSVKYRCVHTCMCNDKLHKSVIFLKKKKKLFLYKPNARLAALNRVNDISTTQLSQQKKIALKLSRFHYALIF